MNSAAGNKLGAILKRYPDPVEYPIERAERLAKIMGENSAMAHALAELKRRRANGENVVLLVAGSTILVGPPLSS